jgi:hypothetical protein
MPAFIPAQLIGLKLNVNWRMGQQLADTVQMASEPPPSNVGYVAIVELLPERPWQRRFAWVRQLTIPVAMST